MSPGQGTVFVVEDDRAVRDSHKWLMQSAGMQVVAYGSAEEFLAELRPEHRGCLLLDIRMPGMDGLSLLRQLQEQRPDFSVIISTGHADVPMAIEALKNGALDLLEKPVSDGALLESVQHALEGVPERCRRVSQRSRSRTLIQRLTPREQEILSLVVEGWTSSRIAFELGIKEKTVEVHRGHIRRKTETDSLAGLVRLVMLAESSPR